MNELILSALQQLRPHLPATASVCCLGYPDVLVSEDQARRILGPETAARLTYRADSNQILTWHNLHSRLERVIDTQSLFEAMGMRFTAVDLVASRGCERVVDLNEPLASDLLGAFDIVLDAGTMEHCFNVGQAIRNIVDMTNVGGFVIHNNPLTMVNHGFFNFSPTFYYDFYRQNGHHLVTPIYGVLIKGIDVQAQALQSTDRQMVKTADTMIMCVARKKHGRTPIWPTQSKYLKDPGVGTEQPKSDGILASTGVIQRGNH